MSDLREALQNALVTQFKVDRNSLDDNTNLFSSGLIDSLSVMELILFVEGQLGQPVPPTAITLENFDSIAQIIAFAGTLTQAGQDA